MAEFVHPGAGIRGAMTGGLAAAALVVGAAGAAAAQPQAFPSPLRPIEGGVPGITIALELDPDGYRALEEASRAVLTGFVLAPDRIVDLEVERFDVFSQDAQVVIGTVKGNPAAARPEVVLLRGHVAGKPESRVFLGLSPYGVNGRITSDAGEYILSSGPYGGDQPLVVYRADTLPDGAITWAQFVCGADEIAQPMAALQNAGGGGHESRSSLPCRTAQMAIESDWQYSSRLFGGNANAAAAYATTLIAAVSELYVEELNTTLEISYMRMWSSNSDPYPDNSSIDTRLDQFRNHWVSSMGSVQRDVAHMLSGRSTGSGGIAWLSALCGSFGYAVSGHLSGHFPYPLVDNHGQNWDIVVVAHELGHNFGAPHTHSMSPPVDQCGNGGCGDRHLGTIMSYCHTCTGGMNNIELTLHSRVINERILPFLNNASCISSSTGPLITFDPDGIVACAGEEVSLTVGVSGSAPLSYQWRLDGVDIPGANAQTYTIDAVTPAHQGFYDVLVSNGCGAAVSGKGFVMVSGACPADINGDCVLDLGDFSEFRAAYLAGDLSADFNNNGVMDSGDFTAFRAAYLAGCP